MPKEPKAHQLYKQLAPCNATYKSAGSEISGTGWEIVSDSSDAFIVANRTYIDLAGWSAQDLTTFVQGVDIQQQNTPLRDINAQGMLNVYAFDILTTRQLTLTECNVTNSSEMGPGFLPSTVDLMEVIYGERMEYAVNATVGFTYVQISGETFGSGNPTAMDKLHWTRIYVFFRPENNDLVSIFPANLVVQAMTSKEKDLVWMERLRRSYVLQNEIV
jgi:hypothetical protein